MDNQTNPQDATLPEIPLEIRLYLENILKDAGITPPDDNLKNQIIDDMYVKLDNFLTTVIIENMPPQYLDEFMKMNEDQKPKGEIEQFMREKIPNTEDIFAKAFIDFRDLYLGNAAMQGSSPPANPT